MNREKLEVYIQETYPVEMDNPWVEYPRHTVFRHPANRKWFALAMSVPREKLGLAGEGLVDAVNLKCDPRLVGPMCQEPGFLPAYHMSKVHWITVLLDGTAEEEKLKFLLEMSYDLTRVKRRAPKPPGK